MSFMPSGVKIFKRSAYSFSGMPVTFFHNKAGVAVSKVDVAVEKACARRDDGPQACMAIVKAISRAPARARSNQDRAAGQKSE